MPLSIASAIPKLLQFSGLSIQPVHALWTPTAGRTYYIKKMLIASSLTGNVVLSDVAGLVSTNIFTAPLLANVPQLIDFTDFDFGLGSQPDAILKALGPGGSTLSGSIWGYEL